MTAALLALASATASAERFSFLALGDMPYAAGDVAKVERLIERANVLAPAFSVHVGDIKNGSAPCVDEAYTRVHALFARFEHPLVYTPGDNEWTDCHRGGDDPQERLAHLRRVFFSGDRSLGRRPLRLARQSSEPAYARYVENARWEHDRVVFATVHVVGSNNNRGRSTDADAEYAARNAADLAWLDSVFSLARASDAPAVVLFFQADFTLRAPGVPSGFDDFIARVTALADRFRKPVLLVHGDSHRLLIDQPLRQGGTRLSNVTRLVVFGEHEVHGVLVSVNTGEPGVFGFTPVMVPENVDR